MEESTSAQVHRSGRKGKAHSKHDHKCHKAKHKSPESLPEKPDRFRSKTNLLKKRNGFSIDSGLSQAGLLSPFEAQFGIAYQHVKNENIKLKDELEKLLGAHDELKSINSSVSFENENLKSDVFLMKNLVYKLNVELERYQKHGGAAVREERSGKLPKMYEKDFLRPVLPLLKAYCEALEEKNEMIKELESEQKKFSAMFRDIMEENEKLYSELEKKLMRSDGGGWKEAKVVKKELEMAKRENDLLSHQIQLEKEKLEKIHSIFKLKVEEISRDKEEANQNVEESKSELLVLRGKYAVLKQEFERIKIENDTRVPLAVYSASINECQKLFQDLKLEYENEKQRLLLKLKQQEGILRQEVDWAEEKNLVQKSNCNQFSEIESLRKKVFELERELELNGKAQTSDRDRKQLQESKKQLREANKKVEELSRKLSITRKQLQKAMVFAEEIVRGQEGLLLQLHAKQKENSYMTSQFGSLKTQLKDVEKGAQKDLNTIEEKIKSLEAENYTLGIQNQKLEKELVEKNEIIRKLEPTKDL